MADFHRKAPPPAMAYYGDVFGGPPKFSAAGSLPPSFPPQVDEYGEIFRGFSLRKGGGGGAIPFLDLPMLDEDEVSLSVSGFDYSEIFGGVGCGSFAMDLDQVLSQQRRDKDPSAINGTGSETGRPYPATMLTEECSKNCLSASDQFSSYESSQHVQDGIQQVNVSYNKSNYVTKGDPLNGTTHIAQLHEIPGFTVVVDSFSPHSKMESSGTTLNGGLSDLSSSAMEKDLAKQSRSQVSFSGDAQRVSRNNIVRTEDIKLDSTSTGGKESHAEESCSSHNSSGRLSSDWNENLKKLEAHPPASENIPACRQSLYSGAHVRSIGDESPACKAFLTVSDINLRTQPSVLPPPSRPPPKSGVKKMKENLSKACAASPPFLDVEIDVTSDAAASAAAMREAMAKAKAKLKSAKESMERRRDNNLNRLKFTLNEDHKGVATLERKIADKDRKSKEDEAEEAFVSRYSGPKFHGIGAHLRATTGDYEIAGFDEKFGHRRHNKIEESLANGYSKELGANNLDCNLGQKSVEWKAEKQFYELVNNGPNLEVGNEVSEGNNDQKLKVVIQSLDQESSSKAAKLDRLAVKNEKLRAFQGECDNRFKTSSDLEEVVGNKLSLSKDDGGNVNAIFFGENDMKVGEVKETNVQESEKNWRTFNKIEDKNKLKTVSDFEKRDKLRAIYGNEEMVEQKTARKHKEEDSRQIANYVYEEEEKRQIATQTWEHEQKHLRVTRECEEGRNRLKEACELEEEKKAARDCEEEEKKLKTALEREDAEKRLKMARDHEEEEKRLKMPRDREQEEKRLKMACQNQEEEKKLKVARERQEEEKRLKVAREREEEEERLKMAREREEEEKRLKVAREREEEEQRLKVAHEHEEEEKRLKMAREHEEEEKRLKVARECEEEEKRLKVAREREEEEKRLKVARECEEEEKRLKVAREREEEEKRLKVAREREEEEKRLEVVREHEEEEKRLKVAREREEEEKRLKVAHEYEEEEKRLKVAHEHEEEEERLKLARKVEEEENRLRAAHELEEEENRLRAAPELEEGEKSLKAARQCGGEDKRMKVAHEREEEEKRLRAACEIENEEKNLKAARESEEERLKATCKCEEEENMKSGCHAEERLMRQEVHIHEVKIKVSEVFLKVEEIGNNWEKLKGDQNLQADEKIESDLQPENRAQVPKKCNKIQSKDKNENKVEPDQELNAENEIRVNMIDEVSVCATNGNNLTAVEKVYNGEQTVEKIETAYEANQNEKRFAGSLNNVVLKDVNGTNVMEPPLASVSEKNKKKLKKGQVKFDQEDGKQPKGSNVTREFLGEEKVAEKDYMASGREEINDSFSAAREASTTVENGGRSRDAEVDGVLNEKEKQLRTSQQKMSQDMNKEDTVASQNYEKKRKEKEEQLRRYRDLELERLKILEEEREREREREKDRIAVERATRDARERAFGEVRERAERAAVERATAEARQRALAEARERAEKASLAEKAGSEAARLRVERAAVERATAEARQRAAEKAMAAVKDRSNGGMGQNISSFEDRNLHVPVGESAQRCKARLERHQRTAERAAKALAEKNLRDVLAQREQVERNRLAENLGADIRRWSNGKEGNLRALLSTLQYILGPESGWQPVPLTEVITAAAVKKAYRKATLCVHPDKVQQRGASIQQKYICEKVFDLLKDAWNKFNSEER